jgi:hypothetical protein
VVLINHLFNIFRENIHNYIFIYNLLSSVLCYQMVLRPRAYACRGSPLSYPFALTQISVTKPYTSYKQLDHNMPFPLSQISVTKPYTSYKKLYAIYTLNQISILYLQYYLFTYLFMIYFSFLERNLF